MAPCNLRCSFGIYCRHTFEILHTVSLLAACRPINPVYWHSVNAWVARYLLGSMAVGQTMRVHCPGSAVLGTDHVLSLLTTGSTHHNGHTISGKASHNLCETLSLILST